MVERVCRMSQIWGEGSLDPREPEELIRPPTASLCDDRDNQKTLYSPSN